MAERFHILVIDDDEDDYVVTRDILEDVWGDAVEIDWAPSYREGVAALSMHRHDACLLDYNLGAKTGVDLMMELGDDTTRTPIILMTGSDEASVDLAAMNAGAADYLVKGQASVGLVERSVRYAIARGQAEKQRRVASVVEFAHDAIIQVGADGVIRSWNAGAYRVFGLTPEEAIGQPIECVGCNDPDLFTDLFAQTRRGLKVERAQLSITRVDGDDCWVSIQVSPAAAGAGVDEEFSVIASDITESKQAELRRNNFVSIASHELRTPMTSVLGFSELLLARDVSDELRHEWLEAIHTDGMRMSAIIESLLNVSTIQSGRLDLALEPLDVVSALEAIVAEIAGVSPGYRIHIDAPGSLPAAVVDAVKFGEIFTNLIGNAVKYSPAGGDVHVNAGTDAQGNVVIMVTDEGLGIAEDDVRQLFTSFHRVRRPETVSVRGTGLGLYIVKVLVEMMHGSVEVSSELNVGSAFSVTFPSQSRGELRRAS